MIEAPPNEERDSEIIVLLVDDQPIVGEAVRRAVAGEKNISLHFCTRGAHALPIAERVKPTVILQDLVMPDIDGRTLLRNFRANALTKDIPLIVLSTKDDPAIKSDAFAHGANDYLVKLPDKLELVARIRYHSNAYANRRQRDEAYRALRESRQLLLAKNLELERLTNLDGLTGLSNRRYFSEFAELHWKQAVREQAGVSILMLDVDDFKRCNDAYGHLAGDAVLRRVADVLRRECRRPIDLAARFGGEEFVIFLFAPTQSAHADGERFRLAVEAAAIPQGESPAAPIVTVSVGGAARIPRQGESPLALIEAADAALYEAKRNGKNCVVAREAAGEPPLRVPNVRTNG